jgi:3-deoxy-D-manno-octulosonate 8-phosphate phosphatase KdsC-like HAD superfamily phosphatase
MSPAFYHDRFRKTFASDERDERRVSTRGKGIASLLNTHEPSNSSCIIESPQRGGTFNVLATGLTNQRVLESRQMPKLSAHARARKIKLLLFDVDGVLTDGKLFIFPAPAGAQQTVLQQSAKHGRQGGFGLHGQTLIEAKGFHAHDGTAISLARLAGIHTGLITKRISETVALRARDLKLEHIHQGVQDKRTCLEKVLRGEGFKSEEAAFVGDDVIDLPAIAPAAWPLR